eukprot:TRINITY_DN16988_c0_g1_i1.p2 TRINITY_DN16988_c0_g1~~TRINITY_DN16988_c0_g1_i1.p2  ORF type:complete len:121 (+),score=33.73 TRINITY_DN16988_c0_g1_i1:867-1229(+)
MLQLFDKYSLPVVGILAYIAHHYEKVLGQQEFINMSVTSLDLVSKIHQAYRKYKGYSEVQLEIPPRSMMMALMNSKRKLDDGEEEDEEEVGQQDRGKINRKDDNKNNNNNNSSSSNNRQQ